jgi:hypothetical protein
MIIQYVAHVARIVLPVRGKPPDCAASHSGRHKIGEAGVEQPPLVMPRLVPGVGEEQPHLIHRVRLNKVSQSCDGVPFHNPHIADLGSGELSQHAGNGRLVDLEGQYVRGWPGLRHRNQRITCTRSDFDDQRRGAAKGSVKIKHSSRFDRRTGIGPRNRQHEPVVVPLPGPPLLRTHSRATANEGGDLPPDLAAVGVSVTQLEMSLVEKRAQAASQNTTV